MKLFNIFVCLMAATMWLFFAASQTPFPFWGMYILAGIDVIAAISAAAEREE